MRNVWKNCLISGACVLAIGALGQAKDPGARESRYAGESGRLRAHFAEVLVELRNADVSQLSPAQRTARYALIQRLEEYAAAERFPRNQVAPDDRVPVFRDAHGTLCAMGFLIASTGRDDIVDDVAAQRNLAYIPELADEPRLQRWLDSTGLTVAEAARIQPAYNGCRMLGDCTPVEPPAGSRLEPSRAYRAGSLIASTANGILTLANGWAVLTDDRSGHGLTVVGAMAGVAQLALGTDALYKGGEHNTLGAVNLASGALSLGTAVWRIHRLSVPGDKERSVAIHPMLGLDGRSGGVTISLQ